MNSSIGGNGSGIPALREGEDNMNMFFDFESPPAESLEPSHSSKSSKTPQPSTTKSSDGPPRGGIRVSLACIPCRSRHVKCGAEMPACNRCQQDDKPCFYAKSRRGMRDRNAPKKNKTSTSRTGSHSPTALNDQFSFMNVSSSSSYMIGNATNELYTGSSNSSTGSPTRSSSIPTTSRQLVDLFYTYFYKSHPFVLPRYYFLTRLESDPSSLTHLLTIMQYIGSLYSPTTSSQPYRDLALAQLDLPSLPPTGFTVQTLLLTAIALQCEDDFTFARVVLDRAVFLAVEMRMNCREYSLMEADPVLAESWRRTYWGLCTADETISGGLRAAPNVNLGAWA
ncbi:hypothetical protein BGZ60DRAFT_241269 [Tricladium varicosporioides]|nr:hypothetical protein BGZ60DRAFT_241269 [Hymenoscyphus varicosporioides]